MSVIVTDTGFHADDWHRGYVVADRLDETSAQAGLGVELGCGEDSVAIWPWLHSIAMIRIRFASYTDPRGFALARRLRDQGFDGRLRAQGHVLAHQYTLARRSGFDEVEISADLALRQPEEHWRFRGNWRHAQFHSMMPA
jgi:uncharacterized protein (DUF934 family)